jgi:hypothetical protein
MDEGGDVGGLPRCCPRFVLPFCRWPLSALSVHPGLGPWKEEPGAANRGFGSRGPPTWPGYEGRGTGTPFHEPRARRARRHPGTPSPGPAPHPASPPPSLFRHRSATPSSGPPTRGLCSPSSPAPGRRSSGRMLTWRPTRFPLLWSFPFFVVFAARLLLWCLRRARRFQQGSVRACAA